MWKKLKKFGFDSTVYRISIGETFLDHLVLFSQNTFFNEASVIKSGMS
jgi:hypothetical protein